MKTNHVNMTVADYCSAFERNEVVIDRTYQRSPHVWPSLARSYLIETILKDFPIPKLALHQQTDLKSRQTIKYVVDGQQRTMAIRDFYADELRLGRRLELADAAGLTYSELPDDLRETFLSYVLVFDQFEGATDEDVREYFRRINSFTAPLNPEEQRHAQFQGPMKWLVYELSERWGDALVGLGVLTSKAVVRMGDAKLMAEITHALLYGIKTTSKSVLNAMYREYDKGETFDGEDAVRSAVNQAFGSILSMPRIEGTALMRTHIFYSLLLAMVAVQRGWPTLPKADRSAGMGAGAYSNDAAVNNLLTLAAALEEPETYSAYVEFTRAAQEKTNVESHRTTRVRWLIDALTQPSI